MSFKINKNNLKGNEQYLYEMGFSIDPSNVGGGGDFKPIEKGEYEVYPTVFEMSRSQSGNEMATFNYVIRDDVDQPFKGREVRYDRFVFTDNAMWRVNQASVSAGLDPNKEYADGKEWASDFKNKAVRIFVDINDKGYAEVRGFKKSEVGGTRTEDAAIDISDEEMPF